MTAKELYKRERRNLQRRLKAWEKKGYRILIDIPSIPKKITKASAKALQKIQLKDLIKKGKVVSMLYGGVINPYEYEEEEQLRRAEKKRVKDISLDMSEEFHRRNGTEVERKVTNLEQITPELDELQEQLFQTNLRELQRAFVEKRQQLGDEEFYRRYDLENDANELQQAVGLAIEYYMQGKYFKAGEYAIEAIQKLEGGIPIPAQVFDNTSMDANYAP